MGPLRKVGFCGGLGGRKVRAGALWRSGVTRSHEQEQQMREEWIEEGRGLGWPKKVEGKVTRRVVTFGEDGKFGLDVLGSQGIGTSK